MIQRWSRDLCSIPSALLKAPSKGGSGNDPRHNLPEPLSFKDWYEQHTNQDPKVRKIGVVQQGWVAWLFGCGNCPRKSSVPGGGAGFRDVCQPEPPSLASPQFTPSYRRGPPWPSWAPQTLSSSLQKQAYPLCPSHQPASGRPPGKVTSCKFLHLEGSLHVLVSGVCRFQVSVLAGRETKLKVFWQRGPQPRKGRRFNSSAQGCCPEIPVTGHQEASPLPPPSACAAPAVFCGPWVGARGQAALAAAPPPEAGLTASGSLHPLPQNTDLLVPPGPLTDPSSVRELVGRVELELEGCSSLRLAPDFLYSTLVLVRAGGAGMQGGDYTQALEPHPQQPGDLGHSHLPVHLCPHL